MKDVFNLVGFEAGYKQALTDLLEKYKVFEDYDEIFIRKLKRDIKKLLDENGTE